MLLAFRVAQGRPVTCSDRTKHVTTLSILRPTTDALETVGDVVKMKRSDDAAAECPATGVHRFALVAGKLAEIK